jgi:glycosyltransferase involved in cell wall biosynthesis
MENQPLISVVIPVYNVEKYLNQCVDSLLNQDFKNYEIILINDGSKDSSPVICDEYSEKYDNIITLHQENSGVGDARNKGIEIAKGEYLYFLDSDDFVVDTFFETVAPYLSHNIDVLQFGFTRLNVVGQIKNAQVPHPIEIIDLEKEKSKLAEVLNSGVGMALWDKIIKTAVIRENDILFDEKKRGQDMTFNIELFKNIKSISVINKPLINYRIIMGTGKKHDSYLVENHIENFDKIYDYFGDSIKSNVIRNYLINLFSKWFFMVIPINIAANIKQERKHQVDEVFESEIIVSFLKNEKKSFNSFQKLMSVIVLNKNYTMYLLVGRILLRIRKIIYT